MQILTFCALVEAAEQIKSSACFGESSDANTRLVGPIQRLEYLKPILGRLVTEREDPL
jgi:hypothetical protein